jgi:fibronectin type 3 domain-containing protein
LDGTSPTANYTTYTAPFYLSGSSLVSAVVSSSTSGVQLSQIGTAQFYINDPNSTGFPPTPTGLTVASASAGETDLSWTDNGAATYSQIYVYRSTNGGAYELIATLASSATTYADTNVQSGTSYQYKIGSLNSSGESDTAASTAITPATAASLEITVSTPTNATPLP